MDNLKTDCKKRSDDLQKHLKKTGAAPDSSLILTAQEERVLGIMNVVKTSLQNPFDDDSACSSKTYRCSSAPAVQLQESEDNDSTDSRADSRAGQEEDIGSGDDEIEIVAAEGSRSRSTSRLPTPTPVKRRKVGNAKLTREDLDRTQMEIWELQKQQMAEKHQAYLDTLDHIKSVISMSSSWKSQSSLVDQPEQTAQPDQLDSIRTAMSWIANLDTVENLEQL